MSEAEPLKLSTLQRFNRLRIDDAFWQRNTFTNENAHDLLLEFLVEYDLLDPHLEAVTALTEALKGMHPHMAINVERIPNGKIPRPLREQRKGGLAMAIADKIDMQVAQGVKQDSRIHEVMQESGISRREIFRMLKTARQERVVLKSMEHQLAEWDCWYEGYDIAADGTLVPTSPES